jgi:hypothetical protein
LGCGRHQLDHALGYAVNDAWQSQIGIFQGAAGGIVTIAGSQAFEELRFRTGGYNLVAAAGGGSLQAAAASLGDRCG